MLRQTAVRLRQATRPQDTVARLAGDEFVVVCPALTAEDEAVTIADRLAAALSQPVRARDGDIPVSASIGVAFAGPGATAEQVLHEADTAMYRAKSLGRKRFEVYDAGLRTRAAQGRRVRDLVAGALAEDRVVVHYQPVVELVTGRVVGLEALMRLRDRDGTLLAPDAFLDVAADEGLLPALDLAVLRAAAAQVVTWSRTYARGLDLSVNVCAGQLDDRVAERVGTALADAHLPAGRLVLDVTERAVEAAGALAGERLRALTGLGVRVALDDVGLGPASLVQLQPPAGVQPEDRRLPGAGPAGRPGRAGPVPAGGRRPARPPHRRGGRRDARAAQRPRPRSARSAGRAGCSGRRGRLPRCRGCCSTRPSRRRAGTPEARGRSGRRRHRQPLPAAQHPGVPPARARGQREVGQPVEQRAQPDLALEPGQRGAEAEVPAAGEGQVLAGVAAA